MNRVILVTLIAVTLTSCFGSGGSRAPTHPMGSDVTIKEGMLGALDEGGYSKLVDLSSARDGAGVQQMVNQGDPLFFAESARGTVTGRGLERLQVRVESGPHRGSSVWVVDSAVE
jgi:hypothetical protein